MSRRKKKFGNWPEYLGTFIGVVLAVGLTLGIFALQVWIVVLIVHAVFG